MVILQTGLLILHASQIIAEMKLKQGTEHVQIRHLQMVGIIVQATKQIVNFAIFNSNVQVRMHVLIK
jgi:uncharacterized Fe-S radical SAM superfamily protein PflX